MCMHIFYEVTMLTHVDLYDIICSGNKFKMIFFFFLKIMDKIKVLRNQQSFEACTLCEPGVSLLAEVP